MILSDRHGGRVIYPVVGKSGKVNGYGSPEFTRTGDHFNTSTSFVYHCGCASVQGKIRRAFEYNGFDENIVPRIRNGSTQAKDFLKTHGYLVKYPSMDTSGGSFAYLIDVKTGTAINLEEKPEAIAADIKRVMKEFDEK